MSHFVLFSDVGKKCRCEWNARQTQPPGYCVFSALAFPSVERSERLATACGRSVGASSSEWEICFVRSAIRGPGEDRTDPTSPQRNRCFCLRQRRDQIKARKEKTSSFFQNNTTEKGLPLRERGGTPKTAENALLCCTDRPIRVLWLSSLRRGEGSG